MVDSKGGGIGTRNTGTKEREPYYPGWVYILLKE